MPSKSQASQAKKKKTRVSKRKVVPQYGGLFGFFENKNDAAAAPGAAPVVAPPAPAAPTEPAKPGFFSGWFGSNKPTEEPKKPQAAAPENKGSWWNPFGSKSTPEPAAAPANGQKGGRKRKSKK